MAVTITRTQVRGEMLTRVPLLGRRLTADSIGANTLTHAAEYERQRAGLTSFEAQYIHRYLQSDPDRWRLITTLNQPTTDGVVNVDGPVYPAPGRTDLAYERLMVHPDDINFAIAEGQRRQKVLTNIALVRGHDLDMELGNTNYWGTPVALGSSSLNNASLTKVSNDVFSGTQALTYAATGSGSLARGELLFVMPNRQIFVAIIARAGQGTFNFKIYDASHGVYIGNTLSITGPCDYTLMSQQLIIPAGCTAIQYEFSTLGAADTAAIDTCFGPYQAGQTEYPLQSAFNEAYKLRFVRPAQYLFSLGTPGLFDAYSATWAGDLTSPEDWNAEIFRRDVNSNRIRFVANSYNNHNVGWGLPNEGAFMSANMHPIWLAMEAQVSDFEPLLTEASLTSQPLDECACFSLRSLFETLASREPQNPAWPPLLAEYAAWAAAELVARPPQPMLRPVRMHLQRV
jgi:hypothetical protein